MATEERYDCPQSLVASVERFDSLQCQIRACSGAKNLEMREMYCGNCEKYIVNAMKRDHEILDRKI